MRLKQLTMPAALLVLLCAACNSGNYKETEAEKAPLTADVQVKSATADTAKVASDGLVGDYKDNQQVPRPEGTTNQAKHQVAEPAPNPDWDKKIIKTADLGIEVRNFRLFSDRLRAAAKQFGAYIAQEQLSQSASEIENTVTLKVPVGRFEDLMGMLPSDSDKMVSKHVSSEDVTMEMVDTKSRLETKKEVRERYLDLLKQAHSMKDIIAVQNEINDIQQEMDQASGRIAYLGHSSAFSTINLHYFQVLDVAAVENPSPNFIIRLKDAVAEGWRGLSSILLQLISIWPLWIALLIGIPWLRKWLRTLRLKTEAVRPPEVTSGSTRPGT